MEDELDEEKVPHWARELTQTHRNPHWSLGQRTNPDPQEPTLVTRYKIAPLLFIKAF